MQLILSPMSLPLPKYVRVLRIDKYLGVIEPTAEIEN